MIEVEFNFEKFCQRANKAKEFPNVEFLQTLCSTVNDTHKDTPTTPTMIPINRHKREIASEAESPIDKPKLSTSPKIKILPGAE